MIPRSHRMLSLASAVIGITAPCLAAPAEVTPVPDAVRAKFGLAPFYQKCLDLDGLPILGSERVSEAALREAAWLVRHLLAAKPEILGTLKANGVRLVVMAATEYTTDLPEQADWKPKDHWDRRARGMGGQIGSCGEENLLGFPGDPYSTENILIHEFAHTLHDHGLGTLIPDFDRRVRAAYDKAIKAGLWRGTYAAENHHEYWAEGVQDWFDNNRENDAVHNSVNTRAELKDYDPALAALCREVFGDGSWRYQKPWLRPPAERSHLAGFDPATAPAFQWRAAAPQPVPPAVPVVAKPLPLAAVRLTGGPLKHAQDLDAKYLLQLEPDRMLYHLRERAGLKPRAAEGYGGWDGGGRQLTGHIAGHYLSAVSYMFAATGDPRFKQRADYLVRELKEIQDAQGDGYLGGLMAEVRRDGRKELVDGKRRFEDLGRGIIESGGFDLNGMWSPWYVQHKLYAGLRDAYRLTGNRTALDVEIRFAAWADGILAKLSDVQIQRMLATEFGAMNEIMADLYADTGDRRWERAYRYFEHRSVVEPLSRHEDILPGKHGNTQVPKLYGELIHHLHTGAPASGEAAKFFWDTVAANHSYATGGHGKDEYFGEPGRLNDRVDGRTAETCNVYNMLKMARTLFSLYPDAKYAEFEERALFNHILASIDDQDGRTCYMVPVGRGVTREYQDMLHSFTCCVGSGMESHALHGNGIYHESPGKLWVNLYTPSTADWKAMGARIEVLTDMPEGESVTVKLRLAAPRTFTLALRRPAWAGAGFAVTVNGAPDPAGTTAGYIELNRAWRDGDTVELKLPKTLRLEPVPDNPNRVALLWGPLVLAGDIGPEDWSNRRRDDLAVVPVLVTDDRQPANWLKPIPGKPGTFRTAGVGRGREIEFVPFYRLHRRAYAVYWDLFGSAEWDRRSRQIAAEREQQRQLELATVAYAQPGEMQAERDFNQQGEATEPERIMGRAARRGSKWFSYDLPVAASHPLAVVVTYYSDEWRKRTFEILIDGRQVGSQTVEKGGPPRFFEVRYPIPAELVQGKKSVTVRFEATQGNEIAAVFGIRIIRTDLNQ